MAILLWDASALVKRYATETGSEVVNALFATFPGSQMVTTVLSYAEVASVLVRKRNRGDMPERTFLTEMSALQIETITNPDFGLLAVDFEDVVSGVALVLQHSINASDAAILATFLEYRTSIPQTPCLMVASDHRLIRASEAEGLQTLNPETVTPEQALILATAPQ